MVSGRGLISRRKKRETEENTPKKKSQKRNERKSSSKREEVPADELSETGRAPRTRMVRQMVRLKNP